MRMLQSDASFRRYWQLQRNQDTVMLMDALPPRENVEAFVKITRHLQKLGVRVPEIYVLDSENGFLLLEYLGTQTFTRLLAAGQDETKIYQQAIATLSHIHQHIQATEIALPDYHTDLALAEANLLLDWYIPARQCQPMNATAKQQFQTIWTEILAALPPLAPVLVLRDYHIDNLMLHQDECALLDYQDAVIGSPAYDLVSLIEDARRDISTAFAEDMLRFYLAQNRSIDPHALHQHRIVWGAQRHCKVAGIFVRLWLRDGKDAYLQHLPRVMKLLQRHLHEPELQPLHRWLTTQLGELNHIGFSDSAQQLVRHCTTT